MAADDITWHKYRKNPTLSPIPLFLKKMGIKIKVNHNKIVVYQSSKIKNSIAASDAFFPFIDGIEKLVQAGISAVIQPSGSIRDKEIIKFANQTNTVLIFSKTRHFRH